MLFFFCSSRRGPPSPLPSARPRASPRPSVGGGPSAGAGGRGGREALRVLSRLPGPPRGDAGRGGGWGERAGGPPGAGRRPRPPPAPLLFGRRRPGGRRPGPGRPPLPAGGPGGGGATGLGDDARTGVPSGVPRAQGAFEDWMARWFPRFASRIAFRCVLHPRESRDIRRRELFRGFSFAFARRVSRGRPGRARTPPSGRPRSVARPRPPRRGGGVRRLGFAGGGPLPPWGGRGLPRFASGSRGGGAGPPPACSRCVNDPSAGSPTERFFFLSSPRELSGERVPFLSRGRQLSWRADCILSGRAGHPFPYSLWAFSVGRARPLGAWWRIVHCARAARASCGVVTVRRGVARPAAPPRFRGGRGIREALGCPRSLRKLRSPHAGGRACI